MLIGVMKMKQDLVNKINSYLDDIKEKRAYMENMRARYEEAETHLKIEQSRMESLLESLEEEE